MMSRLFFLLFLILSFSVHSQSTKELIDNLNSINDHQKKAELCRKIALRLKASDWDRAIKYIELAETEAKNSQVSEDTLANIYITAGKMYSSKRGIGCCFAILSKSLRYLQKTPAILRKHLN